jgi:pimeloyl-ACP methyl ester carboxylesterase
VAGVFKRRRNVVMLYLPVALALIALVLGHSSKIHLRAMSVLFRFSDPQSKGFEVRFAQHPFTEQVGTAQAASGQFGYRIYKPNDVSNPAGMVLLHGIHRLGIEEPRLIGFSRALAASGIVVMTPELRDLADYRVTRRTVDQIGIAAVVLSTHLKQARVGVMGLSFAGGLALLAACKPDYADKMGFVVAIGSHDDLGRVSRFFATNTIEKPDGTTAPIPAHEYGALVLAYSHLDGFFSTVDEPAARVALRLWLWERGDEGLKAAQQLSPEGQAEFDRLLHHRDQIRQQLLQEIEAHKDEMAAVSPHGQLQNLKVPALLLHGAGDTVIPASETLWLQQDVPHDELKAVLVSSALIHVNMDEKVSLYEKWALVHFLAQVLDRADRLR